MKKKIEIIIPKIKHLIISNINDNNTFDILRFICKKLRF